MSTRSGMNLVGTPRPVEARIVKICPVREMACRRVDGTAPPLWRRSRSPASVMPSACQYRRQTGPNVICSRAKPIEYQASELRHRLVAKLSRDLTERRQIHVHRDRADGDNEAEDQRQVSPRLHVPVLLQHNSHAKVAGCPIAPSYVAWLTSAPVRRHRVNRRNQ
jgi:hypothetical protein